MDSPSLRQRGSLQSRGSSGAPILDTILAEIQKIYPAHPPTTILDMGCGQGQLMSRLAHIYPQAVLTGSDYTSFEEFPKGRWSFIQQDAHLDFAENLGKHDLVIASEVIEHLENGRHFVGQLGRCVNPGGYLIISTPNIESLTSLLSFAIKGYHSAFGPPSYPAHINSFSVWELETLAQEQKNLTWLRTVFTDHGRMPGSHWIWQQVFPWLGGRRFSDNFMVVIQAQSSTEPNKKET